MSILDKIKQHKIEEVAHLKAHNRAADFEALYSNLPAPRDFTSAIKNGYAKNRVSLIAEIKKASPSKGLIRDDFDAAQIARAYENGGAACLSVLTDVTFFQGAHHYIQDTKEACKLPVLRKDFIIDPLQVLQSRAIGADCILLILAMLEDGQAKELEAAALDLGMHVLIEIHSMTELNRSMTMSSPLIGINNRDLNTFEADLTVSETLSKQLSEEKFAISESGISGSQDVARLVHSGIRSFLIGESLMRTKDIATSTREIVSVLQ